MPIAPGTRFDRYEITAPLGAGGMGEVYLAQDLKLGRKVALKLLPAAYTGDAVRLRRFEQEARAASALNHPNILTIHEIGECNGEHFIATEFIEGETLRQRLHGAKLSPATAINVAAQIAAALAAAHTAGIVHRDIKPENVMLRLDGYVKVLDFGLAKLTEKSGGVGEWESGRADEQTLPLPHSPAPPLVSTDPGAVMGTPQYMSPEQARGEELDARSDIFSLGIVLYEMLTRRAPFEGVNALDVVSAILRTEPVPLRQQSSEVDRELEHIVSKALRKDREERYQHIKDMLIDLNDLRRELEFEAEERRRTVKPSAEGEAQSSEATAETQPPVTTDQTPAAITIPSVQFRIPHSALRLGAALMAVVLVAAAAFFYFKRSSQPVLTNKDTILLTEFDNKTGDTVFDGTLRQGLAVQLQQSPFLSLFPDDRIRQTLRQMNKSPDERVTREVGREVAQRQGLKAVIAGAIVKYDRNYSLTLEASNSQTGETIALVQAVAEGKDQVLKALAQAATQMREKLGESLASVQKFAAPLEEATTPSLEAFKVFSQGRELDRASKYLEAIPFYKRSIELDPSFAYAYARLATMYRNSGQPELATECAQKAFELRAQAGEREKLLMSLGYYTDVTGELDKQFEIAELWKRNYPREWNPPNSLAIRYKSIGQFEKAIEESREAMRRDPNANSPYGNLGDALIRLNRFAEAKETYERALQQKLDETSYHTGLYAVAFVQGNTAGMKQQIDWAAGRSNEYVAPAWQAETAMFVGQLRQAREFTRRAVDLAERRNLKEVAAGLALAETLGNATLGHCALVRANLANSLALTRSRTSLLIAGRALAFCGEVNQAQTLADELGKRFPKDTLINAIELPVIRAAIELQRSNADKAIQVLQPASRYEGGTVFWQGTGGIWPFYLRGQAYLLKRAGTEAATEFQKILDHRGWDPTSYLYPLAQLGLARSAVLQGETAKARKAYQDFFALWKDADADLPILLEAKKEYEKAQ